MSTGCGVFADSVTKITREVARLGSTAARLKLKKMDESLIMAQQVLMHLAGFERVGDRRLFGGAGGERGQARKAQLAAGEESLTQAVVRLADQQPR